MKKVFAVCTIAVTTLFACKKERANIDTRPEVKVPQYRLSSSVYKNYSILNETNYRYDAAGYLVETTHYYGDSQSYKNQPNFKVEYIRNDRHQIIRELQYGTEQGVMVVDSNVYAYSNGSLPTRVDYYSYSGYHSYDSLIWYNDRLISRNSYNDSEMTGRQEMQYDAKGNIQELEYYTKNIYTGMTSWLRYYNFRYDDMPDVKNTIKGYPVYIYSDEWLFQQKISFNNITEVDVEQYDIPSSTTVVPYKSTLVFHHSFDEKGNVVKSARHNGNVTMEYYYEEY